MGARRHPPAVSKNAGLLPINLVGKSAALLRVIDTVKQVAEFDVTVSIFGETGTGKELVARALHYLGTRANGPFVPVNCGSLQDSMVESELFGHKRGAFTDASSNRSGFIEQAIGGTLFLDEIEALSTKAQVSLLRFLQDLQFRPVGGNTLKTADVRIVVASNIDLNELRRDQFRNDLFYRLDVLPIRMPPLRDRREDIPLLAAHFLEKFKVRYCLNNKYLAADAIEWCCSRSWPGNVRELQNSIHRGVLLSRDNQISAHHLQAEAIESDPKTTAKEVVYFRDAKAHAIDRFEQDYLRRVLGRCGGNISQAAQRAKMDRSTLGRLLKKHQIDFRQYLPE